MNIKKYGLILAVLIMTFSSITAFSSEPVKLGNDTLDATTLPLVSAKVIGNELCVIYNIPKGQHATILEDMNFMTITVTKVKGLTFGKTIYPKGHKGLEGATEYHGISILRVPFTIGKDFDYHTKSLNIEAGYQICLDSGTCMAPDSKKVTIPFSPEKTTTNHAPVKEKVGTALKLDPATLPLISGKVVGHEFKVIYNIPKGHHATIMEDMNFMTVKVAKVKGLTFGKTIYPEGKKDKEGDTEYHGIVVLRIPFTVDNDFDYSTKSISFEAGYQFCLDSGTCLAPETVKGTATLNLTKSSDVKAASPAKKNDNFSFILLNLAFAFLGGLILNIMPCVLPVLSIKAMSIVNSAHKDKKEIFKGAMAYTLGIQVCFLILGLVLVGLKSLGEQVNWGFQFQSIGFVVFMATIMFVFGLSLFDLFIIQLPGMQAANKAANSKKGHAGSFFSGVFAVLLATPCSAPLLGTALGWAFSQPYLVIILSFQLIGIGLATPFIVLGFFPNAMRFIPKPGNWMNTFKEFMGFLLMATVIFMLHTAYYQVGYGVIRIICYLLVLGIGCWIYGRFAGPGKSFKQQLFYSAIALAICISAGFYFLDFSEDVKEGAGSTKTKITLSTDGASGGSEIELEMDPHHTDWIKFSPEVVKKLRDANVPIFMDFGAEWCATCKMNEKRVVFTDKMRKAFDAHGVKLIRGDYTRKNKTIGEWIEKLGRGGVPVYTFYLPGEDADVLPEIISEDMIMQRLNKLKSSK